MSDDKFAKAPPQLLEAQKWGNALDTAIKVPFIPFRFGLDSIIGLIPGAGDAAMLIAGFRIITLAKKLGMPAPLVRKMIRTSLTDFALGFIPLVGDVADFFYKSNHKNVRLMEKWWLSENRNAVNASTREKLSAWEVAQE